MSVSNLNDEQRKIYNIIEETKSGIFFLHGKGGTGKSFLIKEILKNSYKNIKILAPTNLAASVYHKGSTIHGFFYNEFDDIDEGYQNPNTYYGFRQNEWCYRTLQSLDTLIIDEISMVRADVLEMINKICQCARENRLPFGGLQVIFVGDLFQLPPVVATSEEEHYLLNEYGGHWFFHSHILKKEIDNIIDLELMNSIRQVGSPDFVKAMNVFRSSTTDEQLVYSLNYLNKRAFLSRPNDAIMIAATNEIVTKVNKENLEQIDGFENSIDATIKIRKDDGELDTFYYDEQKIKEYDRFKMPSQFEGKFTFKIGARVMITTNNRKAGYKNGDYGIIVNYDELANFITVKLDNEYKNEVIIQPKEHKIFNLEYDDKKHQLRKIKPFYAEVQQYPLRLGYAITAHKSQGQTYESIYIDLTDDMFEDGQLYVALSRVKSLEGLYLSRDLLENDQLVNSEVVNFIDVMKGN